MNSPCGRGRPRDDTREQAILDAALELLVEVGYERMSMAAVANRARASKATIYRRWPGKDEMVIEAMRRFGSKPEGVLPEDTGSLRGDLLVQARSMVRAVAGPEGAVVCGVLRAASESPVLANVLRVQVWDEKSRTCLSVLDRAVARGELPAGLDPAPLVEVIMSSIFVRLLVTGGALDDAFAHHLVDDLALPLLAGRAHLAAEQPFRTGSISNV